MTTRRPHTPPHRPLAFVILAALARVSAAHAQGALTARVERSDTPVPAEDLVLERESLHITLDQQHASTTLEQTFVNRGAARLEGTYRLRAG